jgi:hypothetical protein
MVDEDGCTLLPLTLGTPAQPRLADSKRIRAGRVFRDICDHPGGQGGAVVTFTVKRSGSSPM